MADPLKASPSSSNWKKDSAGLIIPLGGASSAKALLELPKEVQEIASSANTIIRGNFPREIWPKLAQLISIAGPTHLKTTVFVANITAGSKAENGRASADYLQGIVQMLVASALPRADGNKHPAPANIQARKDGNGQGQGYE